MDVLEVDLVVFLDVVRPPLAFFVEAEAVKAMS